MYFIPILQVVLSVNFLVAGVTKIIGWSRSVKLRDRLRVAPRVWVLVGALEVLGTAGLALGVVLQPLAWLGGVAAIGCACVLVSALFLFFLRREPLEASLQPALVLVLILVVAVARLG